MTYTNYPKGSNDTAAAGATGGAGLADDRPARMSSWDISVGGGGGVAPRPWAARSPELWFGVGSAPKMSHVAESERARSGCGI